MQVVLQCVLLLVVVVMRTQVNMVVGGNLDFDLKNRDGKDHFREVIEDVKKEHPTKAVDYWAIREQKNVWSMKGKERNGAMTVRYDSSGGKKIYPNGQNPVTDEHPLHKWFAPECFDRVHWFRLTPTVSEERERTFQLRSFKLEGFKETTPGIAEFETAAMRFQEQVRKKECIIGADYLHELQKWDFWAKINVGYPVIYKLDMSLVHLRYQTELVLMKRPLAGPNFLRELQYVYPILEFIPKVNPVKREDSGVMRAHLERVEPNFDLEDLNGNSHFIQIMEDVKMAHQTKQLDYWATRQKKSMWSMIGKGRERETDGYIVVIYNSQGQTITKSKVEKVVHPLSAALKSKNVKWKSVGLSKDNLPTNTKFEVAVEKVKAQIGENPDEEEEVKAGIEEKRKPCAFGADWLAELQKWDFFATTEVEKGEWLIFKLDMSLVHLRKAIEKVRNSFMGVEGNFVEELLNKYPIFRHIPVKEEDSDHDNMSTMPLQSATRF